MSFQFDLKVDLRPLFNWNTNIIFVYLSCEFNTTKTVYNVTFWDQRVQRFESQHHILDLQGEYPEYYMTDINKDLRDKELTCYINWEQMPIVGASFGSRMEIGKIKTPKNYISKSRRNTTQDQREENQIIDNNHQDDMYIIHLIFYLDTLQIQTLFNDSFLIHSNTILLQYHIVKYIIFLSIFEFENYCQIVIFINMKTQNTFNSAQTFQQQINESQTHIESDFSPQSQKILPQESSLSPGKEVHNRINSSIIDQNQHLVLHQFNFQNQNEASLDHPFMQSKKIIISQRDQTFGNSPSSVSRQIHQHQNSYESMNELQELNQQKKVLGNQQENSLKGSPLKDGKIDMLLLQIQQKLNETSPSRAPKIILSDEKGQESNLQDQINIPKLQFKIILLVKYAKIIQDDNLSPVRTKNKTINQRDHQKLKEFYQNTVQFKEQLSQLKDIIKELNSHADDYGHKFQEFQSGLVDYSSKNQYIQEQLQSLKEFNPSRGVVQRSDNF